MGKAQYRLIRDVITTVPATVAARAERDNLSVQTPSQAFPPASK